MKQTFLADHPDRQYTCRVSISIETGADASTRVLQEIHVSAPYEKPKTAQDPSSKLEKFVAFEVSSDGRLTRLHANVRFLKTPQAPLQESTHDLFSTSDPAQHRFEHHPADGRTYACPIPGVPIGAIPLTSMSLASFAYAATRIDLANPGPQVFPALYIEDLSNGGAGEYFIVARAGSVGGGTAPIEFRWIHRDLSGAFVEKMTATLDAATRRFLDFSMPERSFPVHFREVDFVPIARDVPRNDGREALLPATLETYAHDTGIQTLRWVENSVEHPDARVLYFDPFRFEPSDVPALVARDIVRQASSELNLRCTTFDQRITQGMLLAPFYESLRIFWKDCFGPNLDTYVIVEPQSAYFALDFFSTLNPAPILIFTNPPWKDASIDLEARFAVWKKTFPDFQAESVLTLLRRYPRAIYTSKSGKSASLRRLLEKATAGSRIAA